MVVGRLDAVGESEKMQVRAPGSDAPAEGRFRKCRLSVRVVLKDAAAEADKVRCGQALAFLTPAAKDADAKAKALGF